MASNKFVIKCGNFAVLVDVHILPQGSSKDTSWFSDHEKEEVCKLLEEVVASRVKHYLEAPKQRGQWKPMEQGSSGPLFLTAKSLHITAYFMKRWVNLRCALGKRYRELRVFPEKFIVCVSKLDFDPSAWTCDSGGLKEELSNGTSEYFTESAENKKPKISLSEQIKQDILRKIVKRTKPRRSSASKPQISKDSKKVYLGWADSQTENRDSDCEPSLSAQCAVKRRSPGLLKDCTNTAESSLGLPVLEQRKDVHQGQPEEVHSQHKPRSLEQPAARLLSESPPCGSESAPPAPKQSQRVTRAQAQLQTCGSQEELEHFTKVSSEGTPLTSINTEMSEREENCLGPFLEETAPLNSRLFSKQDVTETMVDKKSLTLRKNPSRSLFVSSIEVQTSQNEPSTAPEELPAVPTSCLELHPVSSEKLSQKRKKEVENGLRKLKLRRLKKSKSEILP
ncbi:protein SLX4IP [Molothrus ater]|uniref:protein SLX4IP n=1 Tax=Molothrus ater TaxID=84834 RepID=UPI0023E7DAD0|nr:protein SLX4IP [Molothrus ater]XP_054370249.1 protein SLX4IP [Molothrus ater]